MIFHDMSITFNHNLWHLALQWSLTIDWSSAQTEHEIVLQKPGVNPADEEHWKARFRSHGHSIRQTNKQECMVENHAKPMRTRTLCMYITYICVFRLLYLYLFIYLCIYAFIHACIYVFIIYLGICLFIIYVTIYLFVYVFIYLGYSLI